MWSEESGGKDRQVEMSACSKEVKTKPVTEPRPM